MAALWAYTRTVGIPFGVGGGELKIVGVPDLLATGLGVVAAIGACGCYARRAVPTAPLGLAWLARRPRTP